MRLLLLISIVYSATTFSRGQQVVDTSKVFGVTVANPWSDISDLKEALLGHCLKPTVRIVFDEKITAKEYTGVVTNISGSCFIMGEILDSYYVKDYSWQQYRERTLDYLNTFEETVDIWEIGNEVNGDWLGSTDSVILKIEEAFRIVKNRNKLTALTLYYNEGCFYDKPQYEMFNWIETNLSDSMKQGLDYVWISYYEDDCEGIVLSEGQWQTVFDSLYAIFPNSRLGIGECGTKKKSKKEEYINRYYTMDISTPNYVGGYFWWYYKSYPDTDAVPKTKPLWNLLNTINCGWVDTK